MAKKTAKSKTTRRAGFYLACRPISSLDFGEGCIAVVHLTRGHITWILDVRRSIEGFVQGVTRGEPSFHRVEFYTTEEWCKSVGDCLDAKIPDSDWLQLPKSFKGIEPGDSQYVRSECWTIGIGDDDVLWHFYEKHCDKQLETPTLSLQTLRDMLPQLK
jgi:hypothetical protein